MLRWVVMVLGHKLFDSEATSWKRKTAERKFVFCWQSEPSSSRWLEYLLGWETNTLLSQRQQNLTGEDAPGETVHKKGGGSF
jgi:hypothetical protein